jgi:hypothetical protein
MVADNCFEKPLLLGVLRQKLNFLHNSMFGVGSGIEAV